MQIESESTQQFPLIRAGYRRIVPRVGILVSTQERQQREALPREGLGDLAIDTRSEINNITLPQDGKERRVYRFSEGQYDKEGKPVIDAVVALTQEDVVRLQKQGISIEWEWGREMISAEEDILQREED